MKDSGTYLVIVSLVVGVIAFGGMVYNFQNSDAIGEHYHPTHITTPHTEAFDDTEILQALVNIDLKFIDQRNEYTREIVQTRKLLDNAQIGTGDQQKDKLDEQSGSGTTPKLTIHLDSKEFIRGEIIWISGTAEPSTPVEAVVTDAILNKRYPTANADQNGNYKIAYTTNFDSPYGSYTLFVKSQGDSSQILSFVLK